MPGWACKFSRPNGKKGLQCVAKRRIELTERANYCIMMMYIQVKWVYRLKTRRRRHRLDWRVVEAPGHISPARGIAGPGAGRSHALLPHLDHHGKVFA